MNNKVLLSNKAIKQMSRTMLKGKYWSCVLAILIANIVTNAPLIIVENLTSNDTAYNITSVLSSALGVVMDYGLACFFIAVFRAGKANLEHLSSSFSKTLQVIWLNIINYVQVFLRMFLFIIPGIIRLIKNSQAVFVMADHPEKTPDECIYESQMIMEGNKRKYVSLCLSFIGLSILANVPSMIYGAICVNSANVSIVVPDVAGATYEQLLADWTNYYAQIASLQNPLISVILSAFTILVSAYFLTARVAFYDIASGNLILASEVDEDYVNEERETVDLDD